MNKSGQYIKDFAKENPITTIAIGGVLFFVGRAVVRKIIDQARPRPPKPTPTPIPPVPPPTPTPTPPTPNQQGYSYDSAQYNDWADSLKEAFSGAGTDMDAILRIYGRMKNRFDILALHDAYGKRKISSPYGWDTSAMSLPETLQYELSDGNFTDLNNVISRTGYQY
jgi:hypothetical protein